MSGVWTATNTEIQQRQERFEAKLQLQPNHKVTLTQFSDFLFENGLFEKAVVIYERALQAGEDGPKLRLRLARSRTHVYQKHIKSNFIKDSHDQQQLNLFFEPFNGNNCFSSAVLAERAKKGVQKASHDIASCLRREPPFQRRPLTLFEAATIEFRSNHPERALSLLDSFDLYFNNVSLSIHKNSTHNLSLFDMDYSINVLPIESMRTTMVKPMSIWLRALICTRLGMDADAIKLYTELCDKLDQLYDWDHPEENAEDKCCLVSLPFPMNAKFSSESSEEHAGEGLIATLKRLKPNDDPSFSMTEDWYDAVGVLVEEEQARPLIGLPTPWTVRIEKGRCFERLAVKAKREALHLHKVLSTTQSMQESTQRKSPDHVKTESTEEGKQDEVWSLSDGLSKLGSEVEKVQKRFFGGVIPYTRELEMKKEDVSLGGRVRMNQLATNKSLHLKETLLDHFNPSGMNSAGVYHRHVCSHLSCGTTVEELQEEELYYQSLAQQEYKKAFLILKQFFDQKNIPPPADAVDVPSVDDVIDSVMGRSKKIEIEPKFKWLGKYAKLDDEENANTELTEEEVSVLRTKLLPRSRSFAMPLSRSFSQKAFLETTTPIDNEVGKKKKKKKRQQEQEAYEKEEEEKRKQAMVKAQTDFETAQVRLLNHKKKKAMSSLALRWSEDPLTWIALARANVTTKIWPSVYDFASACLNRLPPIQDLLDEVKRVLSNTKPFHGPGSSETVRLAAEALLLQATALLSLDEIPESIALISSSFELDPSNEASHRFIVTELAIPLHTLMSTHYYPEIKKKKTTEKKDVIGVSDSADENQMTEKRRFGKKNEVVLDIKEDGVDKEKIVDESTADALVDEKEEEDEELLMKRSLNKYNLSRPDLKELEDRVVALRQKVSVQKRINEINYRGLSLIDRLVQTELWRRQTRLKLKLMRSARTVQRAWRAKHRWDEEASWRILFSTKVIFNIQAPKIIAKHGKDIPASRHSQSAIKDQDNEVGSEVPVAAVEGGEVLGLHQLPNQNVESELMSALNNALTEETSVVAEELQTSTLAEQIADIALLPKEWSLLIDRDVKPELRKQITEQLITWQKSALKVQTRCRILLAILISQRRRASLVRLGGYFIGSLTRIRLRKLSQLQVMMCNMTTHELETDEMMKQKLDTVAKNRKESTTMVQLESNQLTKYCHNDDDDFLSEKKQEYLSLLSQLCISPQCQLVNKGSWPRCGVRIGMDHADREDGFLPLRDLVFDWNTFTNRENDQPQNPVVGREVFMNAHDEEKEYSPTGLLNNINVNSDGSDDERDTVKRLDSQLAGRSPLVETSSSQVVPQLNDSELKHQYNSEEFHSLSVIACNSMIASRFGTKTLHRSLKHFGASVQAAKRVNRFVSNNNNNRELDAEANTVDGRPLLVSDGVQIDPLNGEVSSDNTDDSISASYWLPSFSVPLHSVLYPWAKSRNLIISSPSFTSLSVRSVEMAIKSYTLQTISLALANHKKDNNEEEGFDRLKKAMSSVVGSESVLGGMESLHLSAPLLSVHGFIRILQLLMYPPTPKELDLYSKKANGDQGPHSQDHDFTDRKEEEERRSVNNEIPDDDVSNGAMLVPYQPEGGKTASSKLPNLYTASRLFKTSIRASSLHTLTLSGMPLHVNGLKCIGRALLLPKSALRALHLDDIYAYGNTIVPTHLQPVEKKSKLKTTRLKLSTNNNSQEDNDIASKGNDSGVFDYKSVKLKPNLSSKFRNKDKVKNMRSVPGYQGWHSSSGELSEAILAFLPFIQRAHSLITLSMRRPSPPLFEDDSDLSNALVTCLYVNSSLQRLYLEGNAIGVKGVAALLRSSNSRRRRCALQELGLRDQHPILPISIMEEVVTKSRGSSYITEDHGSHLRTLYIPIKHDQPKKTSIIDRQLRIPGALPLTQDLMREVPSIQPQSQGGSLTPSPSSIKPLVVGQSSPQDQELDASSDLRLAQMESLEKHEEEYGTSTVYSGAQRGRLSLPQEVDARLLDFKDDISFVRAATDTIRNNATRLFF